MSPDVSLAAAVSSFTSLRRSPDALASDHHSRLRRYEDPTAAVVAGALWRVAVWSEVKGEERAKPGPEDMNGTQRPGAALSHRPLTGSSLVDRRTAASRRMPMVVSIRTNAIAYEMGERCQRSEEPLAKAST